MKETFLNGRIILKTGDLTDEDSDAIVNAANKSLLGGGGVDGAIHRIGGSAILEECKLLRKTSSYVEGLPTGDAVITTGGFLKAKHVIHTVGPIYGSENGREEELLKQSYINCMRLAEKHKLNSISFPSISTGAFGFPKPLAARISANAILSESDSLQFLETISIVFYSEADTETFLANSGL